MEANDRSGDRAKAQAFYETELLPKLLPTEKGKILVLDIKSGDYALGADMVEADARLLARRPDAYLHTFRVGYPTVGKLGGPRRPLP